MIGAGLKAAWLALWHAPGRLARAMLAAAPAALWVFSGAGIAFTGVMLAYGGVIWKGPWPREAWRAQLDRLGEGQLLAGAIVIVALLAMMAISGLRAGVRASRSGLSIDVERDDGGDAPPAAKVTATAEVEIPAAPQAEAALPPARNPAPPPE